MRWDDDSGNAVVEFLGLALVLMVPLVYLVLVLGRLEAASFAVEGAAREAARTYVAADTSEEGSARAAAAAGIALRDQGFEDDPADALTLSCSSAPCLAPGSDVAARVELVVPLPFVPGFVRDVVPLEVPVSAERVAPVDAYREGGMKPKGDDGQVMILTLGFVVVALLLITVVASAAHVHLERKRLLALADVLALEGADAVAGERYYAPGSDEQPGLPLTDAAVRDGIEQYLRDNPDAAAQWDHLVVLEATSPDGSSAHVHLGALTHPVLVSWVLSPWQDGITLEAESTARGSRPTR